VPLVLGPDLHWPAWAWAWACLAVSGPAFAVLWAAERRVARRGGAPLMASLAVRAAGAVRPGL
jgi:hypothetical protein